MTDKYAFSYVAGPTGSISGEAVLQQTADAINALGGYCVIAKENSERAAEDAAAARSDAATALSNVNSALAAMPELQAACTAATQAATQAQTVAAEAKGAAAAAQTAAQNASDAVASQNSSIAALGERVAQAETAAAGAAETAQSAAETAQSAAETADKATGIARSAVVYDSEQNLRPVNQWTALQNIGAVPFIAPTSVTSVDEEGVETVRTYDLTDDQRTQARTNIGAAAAADLTALDTRVQTLEEAGSSLDGAVLYAEAQTLSAEQQAQARANIGAAGSGDIPTGAMRFDTAQTLTALQQWQAAENAGTVPVIAPVTETVTGEDGAETEITHQLSAEQQAQARANIGAAGADDIPAGAVLFDQAQALTAVLQKQARTNINALAATGDRGAAGGYFSGIAVGTSEANPLRIDNSLADFTVVRPDPLDAAGCAALYLTDCYDSAFWVKTVLCLDTGISINGDDEGLWSYANGKSFLDMKPENGRLLLVLMWLAGTGLIFRVPV